MKRLIPHSSSSNLRVFTSCLLSFLFVMTPLATLAASIKQTAVSRSSRSETDAAKAEKLFKTNQPVVTAQQNNSVLPGIFASFLPPAPTVTATKVDSFAAGD